VLPEPVIDREVSRQPVVAFPGILESDRIGPYLAKGLDQSLGLSVGAGLVMPGAVC
jgi:hypothetical protein